MKKGQNKAGSKKAKGKTPNRKPAPKRTDLAPVVQRLDTALVPYDPLQIYLLEIKQYNLLTRDEEKELGARIREHNDDDAVFKLVTSNLRLVVKIAMDFHRYWTKNLLDLIQEGNLGLLQAVRKFDPYRGIKW